MQIEPGEFFVRRLTAFSRLLTAAAVALTGSVVAVGTATPAAAAPPASCIDTLYLADNLSGNIRSLNVNTGAVGGVLYDGTPGSTTTPNQNGIGAGGAYAISANSSQIVDWTASSEAIQTATKPTAANVGQVAGAVNPATEMFYFGGYTSQASPLVLWTYDRDTNTVAGPVARISVPDLPGGNGDLAFGPDGTLYFVAASATTTALYRFEEPVPTSGPAVTFPASSVTELSRTTGLTGASNGIAFGSDGLLYLGRGAEISRVNPITGATQATIQMTGASVSSTDLASCATPNTVEVTVELPDGRLVDGDQFTTEISGGSYNTPGVDNPTGTTSGDGGGTQDSSAGPALVLPGETYELAVGGAGGTDLSNYVANHVCTDTATGTQVASGPGASLSFSPPEGTGAAVDCVVQLAEPAPSLSVDKSVTPDTFDAAGDELAYEIEVSNTGNVALSDFAVTDPLPGLGDLTCSPVAQGETLPIDGITLCSAGYTVTQDDIDSGEDLVNEATAAGTPPPNQGDRISASDTVTSANAIEGPVAVDDEATTTFDESVTLEGATNDVGGSTVDPAETVFTSPEATDGGTTLITVEGTWSIQPDGSVEFTPAPGYSGTTEPVEYAVSDALDRTETATLTVTVQPGPAAEPDSDTTTQGEPTTFDPLANDTPGVNLDGSDGELEAGSIVFDPDNIPDGGTLSEDGKSLEVPGEGTWTFEESGEVTFQPLPTFVGVTTPAGYLVTDQLGNEAGSTLTVVVTAVDPVANDDSASTPFATPVTLEAGTDDTPGPGGEIDQSLTVFTSGDATNEGTTLVTDEGTWQVEEDGTVTFTPADGFTGTTAPVEYQITDTNGQSDVADLTVTVAVGPSAEADTETTPQNVDVDVAPLENDTPGDLADGGPGSFDPATLALLTDGLPDSTTVSDDGRTLTVPGEGEYVVDPETGIVTFDPEPLFRGDASSVTYTVTDQAGNATTSTITITVSPIDPVAGDDGAKGPAGQPVVVDALENDAPGADTAPLVPGSVVLTSPDAVDDGKTLVVPGEGEWTVDEDGVVTFTPEAGFAGQVTVEYEVSDSNGETATATIVVVVGSAPLAAPDLGSTPQATATVVDLLGNDIPGDQGTPCDPPGSDEPADCDTGEIDPATVVFTEDGQPEGVEISEDGRTLTVPGEGEYVIDAESGEVTFTPVASFRGEASPVSYQFTDSYDNVASSTVTITVRGIDPVASDDAASTPFGTPVTLPGVVDDVPGTDDNGTPEDPADDVTPALVPGATVFPVEGQPEGAVVSEDGKTLTVDGEGVWQVLESGEVEFTPAEGFAGVTSPVVYLIEDENGTTDTAELVVTVAVGPSAEADAETTPQNVDVEVAPLENDTPGDLADGGPGSFDPATLALLTDGLPEGTTVSEDGRTLMVPGEGEYVVDAETGAVTFDPEPLFRGDASSVTYTVTDQAGNATTSTITITVRGIDPVASDDAASTPFGTPVTLPGVVDDVPGTDDNGTPEDPADDVTPALVPGATVFPVGGQPEGAVVSEDGKTLTVDGEGVWQVLESGEVEFTPAEGFAGVTSPVVYLIEDENGTTDTAELTVTVAAGPVAESDAASTAQNTAVTVNPWGNDTAGVDPATGEPGAWDASSVVFPEGQPAGAVVSEDGKTLTVPGEGEYVIDAESGEVTFTPEAQFTGQATPVVYEVTDEFGNPATAEIAITVGETVPVATDDATRTAYERPVDIDVLDNDTPGADDVPLDPSTLRLIDPTSGDEVERLEVPGEGVWSVVDGQIRFEPEDGFSGPVTPVRYVVLDDNGTQATAEVSVVVGGPGVAEAVSGNVMAGQTVTLDVIGAVSPAPGEELLPETLCLVPGSIVVDGELLDPSGDVVECVDRHTEPGVGTWVVQPDGTVDFTAAEEFSGSVSIEYRIEDTGGYTYGSTMTVDVEAAPAEPGAGEDPMPDTGAPNLLWPLLAAGGAILLGVLLLIRRRMTR
ncbi:tandem-95 repeat protein [Ruania suaedae]|uniref:Ig-like domain-containing protein n=1 Tax=Ruania suaedae TaxID=2897774 RepID=UPI001E3E2162|nr:tandem-95 repeat protein [Ruania suaedae]UFU03564.1 tandem-95 repeat protein [Ruania suaedae]